MRKLRISIIFAFVFCSVLSMLGFFGECENVRNDVFRLHVLANSDSMRDQELKLKVRDSILSLSEELFADADTKEEAIEAARKNIDRIKACAINELRKNGCEDEVKVEIAKTQFNTRTYGALTLPAGEYPALRVLIGEAKGKNWWCVMFPQLCLPAAQADPTEVFTPEELALISNGERFELRFKCVEYYEKLMEFLKK